MTEHGAGAARRGGGVARCRVAKRPVVVFVDGLQWAGRTTLGFVDRLAAASVLSQSTRAQLLRSRRGNLAESLFESPAQPYARIGRHLSVVPASKLLPRRRRSYA